MANPSSWHDGLTATWLLRDPCVVEAVFPKTAALGGWGDGVSSFVMGSVGQWGFALATISWPLSSSLPLDLRKHIIG